MPYRNHLRRPAAALLTLLLLLSLMLAGCGPAGSASSPGATAEPSPTSQATVGPAARPVDTEPGEVPTILPETRDAGRSYVEETLFLGDSNTVRYMMYADETGQAFTSLANNIGVVSMGAGAIKTLKCERFKGDSAMYTMPDAVAKLKPRRIIIGFGSNNLGGKSTDASNFIATYKKGLAAIAEAWPYADIIVNAIPPLDEKRSNTNLYMVQVDAFNEALAVMCEEEGYHFLNSAEVLRDPETGWAKKDYTLSDGVHLSKEAVTAFFTYVRTHAYITEDRRPQPLGTIPTPDGVPLGLITKDPIASRDPKFPVEFVVDGKGSLEGETSQMVKKGGVCSTVKAVPEQGWKFDHWTISNGRGDPDNASMTFTVPETVDANGVILTAVFVPDEHEHDWVDVEGTLVEATCRQEGFVKRRCKICDQLEEQTLTKLPHDWDKPYVVTEKMVEKDESLREMLGEWVHRCKVCEFIDLYDGPTPTPTVAPATPEPTAEPTVEPTAEPTAAPTTVPTNEPTAAPTNEPSPTPTPSPTVTPTAAPTATPTPTASPTTEPASEPAGDPTGVPDAPPADTATAAPTDEPTAEPETASSTPQAGTDPETTAEPAPQEGETAPGGDTPQPPA